MDAPRWQDARNHSAAECRARRQAEAARSLRVAALEQGAIAQPTNEAREATLRYGVLTPANPRGYQDLSCVVEEERLAAAVGAEHEPASEVVELGAASVFLDEILRLDEPCPTVVADRPFAAVVELEELDVVAWKLSPEPLLRLADSRLGRRRAEFHPLGEPMHVVHR